MKLPRAFFQRPTLWVAKNLLGQTLVRRWRNNEIRATITETEAYIGPMDLACHASRGRTKRSEVLFWKAGHAYVYLIYGMHYCFNVVTEKEDFPSAVLIRSIKVNGQPPELSKLSIKGPGRVCRALKIDKKFHGQDLIANQELWFENATRIGKVKVGPRIGVDYAGIWAKKPWRLWL